MHLLEMFSEMVFPSEAVMARPTAPLMGAVCIDWEMYSPHMSVQISGPSELATFGSGYAAGVYAWKGLFGPLQEEMSV